MGKLINFPSRYPLKMHMNCTLKWVASNLISFLPSAALTQLFKEMQHQHPSHLFLSLA